MVRLYLSSDLYKASPSGGISLASVPPQRKSSLPIQDEPLVVSFNRELIFNPGDRLYLNNSVLFKSLFKIEEYKEIS